MKALTFGSQRLDHITFHFDGLSLAEQTIAVEIQLHVGAFAASAPLYLDPTTSREFIEKLEALNRSLTGAAHLHSEGAGDSVSLTFDGRPLGHIGCGGTVEVGGNCLRFSFETDQTQLGPLAGWFSSLLRRLETSSPSGDAAP